MELEAIRETYTNAQKKWKILFNLFNTTPETQVIISWCEWHCATFADVVAHLIDTSICVSHYNGRHAIHQAKQAQHLSPVKEYTEDNNDFCNLLQAVHDHHQLCNDLKIPNKAWNLMPKEAQDVFIQECAKLMPTSKSNPRSNPSSVPKQYGGHVSQTHHANAMLVEPMDTLEVADVSDIPVMRKMWRLHRNLPMSCIATMLLMMLHDSLA